MNGSLLHRTFPLKSGAGNSLIYLQPHFIRANRHQVGLITYPVNAIGVSKQDWYMYAAATYDPADEFSNIPVITFLS